MDIETTATCETCHAEGIEPSAEAYFPRIMCQPCVDADNAAHNATFGCTATAHNC